MDKATARGKIAQAVRGAGNRNAGGAGQRNAGQTATKIPALAGAAATRTYGVSGKSATENRKNARRGPPSQTIGGANRKIKPQRRDAT